MTRNNLIANVIQSIKFFISKADYRTGLIFSSASMLDSIVTMIIGILIIKWINPYELGIWQSITILQLYAGILEIGVPSGLNRELPYQYGLNNKEKGIQLAKTAQSFMLVIASFIAVLTLIGTSFLYFFEYDLRIVLGVFVVGLMTATNTYDRYLTVTYRSSEAFIDLSRIIIYKVLMQLILFPIIYFWPYYGLLAYSLTVLVIYVLLKHFRRPISAKPLFNKNDFKELVKIGLPVHIMNYLRGVTHSFNKLILLRFGGVLQVGLFAPVAAIGSMIMLVPSILGNYFFPKMNIKLGQTKDGKTLWPLALQLNLIMFGLAIPFIGISWYLIPILMESYFSLYVEATKAMQIFTINMLFAGTLVSHNIIYAVKRYKEGYMFTIAEFALRFLCPLFFIKSFTGNNLTLLSGGYLVSSFLLFLINLILIRKALFH